MNTLKCTACDQPIDFHDIAMGKPDEFGECSECSQDYGWDNDEQRQEWLASERERRGTKEKPDRDPKEGMQTDLVQFPDDLILQWGVVINQFKPGITVTENLKAYVYPDDLPNLTKDQTGDWEIDRDHMQMKHKVYFGDTERFRWAVPQPDGVYLFSRRFVACPDNTVLLFD